MEISHLQHTIKKPVAFSGIGIHTGELVHMQFCPAPAGTGIVFRRTDLEGNPEIPASSEYIVDTSRSTILGKDGVKIHTVEHVLAAVGAYEIDNLIIEVSNIEPPVGNGSSDIFVQMIEEAGIEVQNEPADVFVVKEPVYWQNEDISLVLIPWKNYKISYTLSYPRPQLLQAQYFSFEVTPEKFKKEISPCRTFALYEEISYLMDKGLIKGGSLSNAVVVHGNAALSKEGLFYPNEMARHKVLDLIGDLVLVGKRIVGHVIANRSGHAAHASFSRLIKEQSASPSLRNNI